MSEIPVAPVVAPPARRARVPGGRRQAEVTALSAAAKIGSVAMEPETLNRIQGRLSSLAEQTRERVQKICDKHGYDPFEAMIGMAQDPEVEDKVKKDLHIELASYLGVKMKPVDIEATNGKLSGVKIVVTNYYNGAPQLAEPPESIDVIPEPAPVESEPSVAMPPVEMRVLQ